ncbi:hypothetical protein HYH03_005680 [Edaphochlamys debaryana]|uniref:Uncharacterized protein n=1 Tax=Edaphochlamys debaryana TaxID=47281 RepID=A0A835Y4X1_9CHLO|nr:hypothetical protein HYH03_005680 [Edaphochlamys debaryana]|eukprot:KAG2496457.1 hypothetical protein HYH03_005680 [Edaphochlamys debaryana]
MDAAKPPATLRAICTASVVVSLVVHSFVHLARGPDGTRSWRSFISATPVTPAWWADAALQLVAFGLLVTSVLYSWLPSGYTIDMKKTVLVRTVALPWSLYCASLIAADVAHLALGHGPRALLATSLAGSVAGFAALYGCLVRLHPLMVRVRKAEAGLVNAKSSLVRTGPGWLKAYLLFRLPTAMAAALCAARATSDTVAAAMMALGASLHQALNPSLGVLVALMVLAIVLLQQLDDVAFAATVWLWLMGLVVATHTHLMVKCFCIALVMALAMRTAFKYVPEDDQELTVKKD